MMALIAGTGLEALFPAGENLPQKSNAWGDPSAALQRVITQQGELLVLNRHGDDGEIPPHRVNYRANIAALRDAGATSVLSINTVGSITSPDRVGSLCVPHQVIDLTWGREATFFDGGQTGRKHIDLTWPFDAGLRERVLSAGEQCGAGLVHQGVYVCMQGPRLETAAEIDYLKRMGGDIVGMTLMPEAALAREAGLAYAAVCPMVNAAAGIMGVPISIEDIETTASELMPCLKQLTTHLLAG